MHSCGSYSSAPCYTAPRQPTARPHCVVSTPSAFFCHDHDPAGVSSRHNPEFTSVEIYQVGETAGCAPVLFTRGETAGHAMYISSATLREGQKRDWLAGSAAGPGPCMHKPSPCMSAGGVVDFAQSVPLSGGLARKPCTGATCCAQ